jgi:hypothetical protein
MLIYLLPSAMNLVPRALTAQPPRNNVHTLAVPVAKFLVIRTSLYLQGQII